MFELEDHYWWFVGRRRLALALAKKYEIDRPEGIDLLDVGCGTGAVLAAVDGTRLRVGVDMTTLALAKSQTRNIHDLAKADATKLPISDGVFDVAIALDILEHVEDDVAAMAEIYRVLRPGGILVLSVPAFMSLWGPHDVALHHFRRYRREEMTKRLRSVGLQVETATYAVFLLFPIVVIARFFEKRRKGPAKAQLPSVPGWMNNLLIGILNVEKSLITKLGVKLPWGSSVVVVARKPR
jgi:SAM-dependent methyltransferase